MWSFYLLLVCELLSTPVPWINVYFPFLAKVIARLHRALPVVTWTGTH